MLVSILTFLVYLTFRHCQWLFNAVFCTKLILEISFVFTAKVITFIKGSIEKAALNADVANIGFIS